MSCDMYWAAGREGTYFFFDVCAKTLLRVDVYAFRRNVLSTPRAIHKTVGSEDNT